MHKSRPNLRPPTKRWRVWPFGRRGNRRVRTTQTRLPVVKPETPEALVGKRKKKQLATIALLLAGVAGASFGGFRFVTTSSHFSVRALKFSTLKHASADALSARAGVALGTNLFAVDLKEIARDVSQEPWVQSAHARRELPSTIVVDVVERQARCVVAFGALYLADATGAVFKRANPDEAAALPVVTGVDRDTYLSDPERARAQVREAVAVIDAWTVAPRPALGEVHLDRLLGATVYTAQAGVAVRFGRVDETLKARLQRFDAVWSALESAGEKPRLIYLDNRARPDRVTVKLTTTKKSET
jgi:cell division protein FtsQ